MSAIPRDKDEAIPHECGDTIVRRFERQAILHAERIAVNDAGEQSSTRWTYRQLNQRANCIARSIAERIHGLSDASSPSALLMNTGAPSVAAIIGTMKAGRVCVPIDSSYPEARIRQMIEDAGAQLLVTDSLNLATALRLGESGCTILNVDELLFDEDTSQETRNLDLDIDPNSAAYLIYTSGSTGRPKGVIETHRNVLHHVEHYAQALDYQPTDRIALLASCSVGQGMKTFCSTLLNGAALCPFNIKSRGVEALAKWMLEEKITVLISVPSVFRRLVRQTSTRSEFPNLRLIRLGGETLHRQDVEDFRQSFSPQCRLVNSFSSTETGNIALFFMNKTTPLNGETVPVGFVSAGTRVTIVDDVGHEVGFDEVGEMVIHSAWLSPGYWRNPKLTQQVFQASHIAGEQTYRTGDLGSLSRDGCLHHHGRKDSQVKIRGFRVELGEVESALTTHAAIREAVVVARPDAHADNSLISFVVTKDARRVNSREVRRFLADKLPQHAIPISYEQLKELPLTSNGKIDRAQLLLIAARRTNRVDEDGPSSVLSDENWPAAPRGQIEKRLAKIWMDVLQVPRVGRHDDFFELGGHSMLTVALLAQIEKAFSQSMAHSAMFGSATIASQAELLRRTEALNAAPSSPNIVALQPRGTRPPSLLRARYE
jgi:amino acid adenylation domain-containing protein